MIRTFTTGIPFLYVKIGSREQWKRIFMQTFKRRQTDGVFLDGPGINNHLIIYAVVNIHYIYIRPEKNEMALILSKWPCQT